MSYLTAAGDSATESEQRYSELARFEDHHYAELLAYEAWAAASRLRAALGSTYLDAVERAEIRDLLKDALDLVADTNIVATASAAS